MQPDSGISAKTMSKNCGRRARMNWLHKNVPISSGIISGMYSRTKWIRWDLFNDDQMTFFYNHWIFPHWILLWRQLVQLLKVPKLEMVQTVDSIKLADLLDKKWSAPVAGKPLNILIQVNTSTEEGSCYSSHFHMTNTTNRSTLCMIGIHREKRHRSIRSARFISTRYGEL